MSLPSLPAATSFVAFLLLSGLPLAPAAEDLTLPEDPLAALRFAIAAAGLDPDAVVLRSQDPSAPSSDAASAHARVRAVLGLEPAPSPLADLDPPLDRPLARLLDALAHAARLQGEALAGWDAADLAALQEVGGAWHDFVVGGARAPVEHAWRDFRDGPAPGLDRAALAAGAYHLLEVGLRAVPDLEVAAQGLADGTVVAPWRLGASCEESGDGIFLVCGIEDDLLLGDHMLIVDLGGDDEHRTNAGSSGLKQLWPGSNGLVAALSIDIAGNDRYIGTTQVQGAGTTTPGVLIDVLGHDTYLSTGAFFNFVQGAGHFGGVGVLYDGEGNDAYLTPAGWQDEADVAWSAQGIGIFGGIGLLYDALGDDTYVGGHLAQGVGDFHAVGLLVDAEGRDDYSAFSGAQGFGDGAGSGLLLDLAGNDAYALRFGHGQGAAIGGTGVLVDVAGDDTYSASWTEAQGWAIDGPAWKPVNDILRLLGLQVPGVAVLLDLAGRDAYSGHGCDICVWSNGDAGIGIDTM